MERCVALEENHNNIIASNSMESSKIDSISVDLMNANEINDAGKCEHFTIRGYVSETRKRDWKLCWPFALDDNEYEDRKCSLPPLCVPKFRFWRCQNCQRMIDGNTSANLYKGTEVCPSLCVDRKEKKPEFANEAIIAQNTQLEENSNQEIHGANSGVMAAVSGMVLKTNHPDDKGKDASLNDKDKELIPCGRSQEAGNVEEALSTDKDVMNRGSSLDSECNASSSESAEIMIGNELQDLHDDDSSCLHRRKARKVRLLTELLYKHGDGDTNHHKTENSASNAIPAASGGSLDASTGANKPPVIHNQLANQGTARKILSQTRKRKLPRDEDWRPQETSSPNKVPKEVRFLKRDFENANAVVHSEADANASARISLQTDLKSHWSKHKIDKISTESKKKNKKTMIFYESLSSPPLDKIVPIETGGKCRDDNKCSGIDGVFLKPMENSFMGREMDLFPLTAQRTERNLGYSKKEGKMPQDDNQQASIVSWNHGRPSEGPMAKKVVEIIPSAPIDIPFNVVGETSRENELNLSLNSCMATGRCDGKYFPQEEDKQTSFLAWPNATFGDQIMRKAAETKYTGDCGFTSNSAANAPFRNGLDGNLSSKRPTYTEPFINEKQNHTSQVEFRSTPLMQQKDFFNTGNHGKTFGSQEHSTTTKKDNGQKFDKFSEQGTLDDIPMDIVELMAKNQYERCLPDAEFDKLQLATTDNPKKGWMTDCSNTHGLGELSLFQKQKHGARNGRNGTIKRAEIVRTAKEKTHDYSSQVDRNQLNISQLEQTHVPAGFRTCFQLQEDPLNGVQHFASSSEGQSSTNCKWFGDITGKTFHHNILQASRTCTACQRNLWQNMEANQNLASIVPKYTPVVYNIPQKFATPGTNIDVLSCMSGAGSMHKEEKSGDHDVRCLQSAANIGKQLRNFSPDPLSRTQAERPLPCKHNKIESSQKPVGSLDLYSNETIPAMQLLSLVDARICSTTPINMEVPADFLRRPALDHDPSPKHISRLVPGAYKASNAMKDLPCHGKNQLAGNSHDGIPAIPTTVGASSSSPRNVGNFRKASDFTAQLSLEKEKGKGSDMHFLNKDISQKSVSASCGFGSTCGSTPVHSMQTIFFGTPEPRMFPSHFHALDNSTNRKIQAPSTSGTVKPHITRPEAQICSLNRNPADFSIPDDKNEYVIKGEDLKISEGIFAANGSGLVGLDVHKRQRKHPTVKEGCI